MSGLSQPERRALERTQRLRTTQTHPDADLLAAFSEQTLTVREREQVLTHLGVCATCREVVSLAAPPVQESLAPQVAANPTFWKWSMLRWGAVAASAVVVVVAVSIGHYEKRAPSVAQVTSDAAPIAVPAQTEQKVQHDETTLQLPASRGVKAPQIRYEKIAPKPSKDLATEQLNAKIGTNLKKETNAPAVHGVIGGMVAMKSATAPTAGPTATDSLTAGKVEDSTAIGLKASLEDNELRRPAPAPPRAPGMAIKSDLIPSASETVEVTNQAMAKNTQPSAAPQATAQKARVAHNDAQLFALRRDKVYNNLDLKWQVTPEGYLLSSADQGRNWARQLPDQRFTQVQAVANHVWACGPDGVLMHSTDGGTNWTRVVPADKDVKLQGEITSIVFADVNHGTLKTSTGETWSTADAGQSWQKQ